MWTRLAAIAILGLAACGDVTADGCPNGYAMAGPQIMYHWHFDALPSSSTGGATCSPPQDTSGTVLAFDNPPYSVLSQDSPEADKNTIRYHMITSDTHCEFEATLTAMCAP